VLAWLGQWLHEVVAIILLAIIVELILPNKTMLRYTRLVVGLILLLTLLNPVLKIFDKDILSNLETSYSSWEAQLKAQPLASQSLEEIQRKGSELANKRDQQSTQLVQRTLEASMKKEVERQANVQVEQLNVEMNWQTGINGEAMPYIDQIVVVIKEESSAVASEPPESKQEEVVEVTIAIDEIRDVYIDQTEEFTPVVEEEQKKEAYSQIFTSDANHVVSILSRGWNVEANQIIVQARNA